MSRQKVSLGTAMTAQAASPQEPMVLRPPRRSPSYLSDLYQHMLRDKEVRGTERRWCQPLRSSNSTGLLTASVTEVARRQHPQSNRVTSCDPHLRPIMRRRARSLPSSPERRRNTAAQCRGPGCSTRRNRVRFADALGLELAEVKVFQSGEDPSIPLHVLSRLSINSDLCCSRRELEFTMQCLVPDFQQPADLEDYPSRLRQQQVCLERVSSSDLGLNGTVRVVNVAFEKQVAVRYTFNHWRGQHEVSARWHSSTPGKDGQDQMDVFTFFLPVPPFLLQVSSVVEFAVRYRVNEQEYWDNNQGENYSLTCRSHPLKMPRECEESWIHFI
ncbi:PREDICTED: protein phosphatase 1 regulatory subunit 3D [Gekko japonicus]|uniref:Protein phosphatase 1 regulatory subunit 3D n=1 Tax=Gekko japonicus TaxID=146911 RepID=A0ABM1L838_GEKJA|nr:PREDICTED: protein phosphatase 1 regulatory subunit 3D [Gekko japonicus]